MKTILFFILLISGLNSWAGPITHHEFVKLPLQQKVKVLKAYKEFLSSVDQSELEPLTSGMRFKFPTFISEAFATTGVDFECLYGGWPSKKVNGKCTHPKRGNPFYEQGSCGSGELQCQPMVFGEGLCADISTQSKRNRTYRQCEDKFATSGRTMEDLARRLDERSTEVNEMFSTVRNICLEKSSSICQSLDEKIEAIRKEAPVTAEADKAPASPAREETGGSARPEGGGASQPEASAAGERHSPGDGHDHDHNHQLPGMPDEDVSPSPEDALRRAAEQAGSVNEQVRRVGDFQCQDETHTHQPRRLTRRYQATSSSWSVRLQDWAEAPCKTTAAPSMSSIDNYLNSLPGGTGRSESKNGVQFTDENDELLKSFRLLVQRAGAPEKDIQREFSINPACTKVLCAVEKIWGPELGKKLLYMHVKYGFNGSEYAFKKPIFQDGTNQITGHYDYQRFTVPQLDQVLMTLGDLPPHLSRLARGGNQPLGVVPDNVPNNRGALADSEVSLWPAWTRGWSQLGALEDSYIKQTGLLHELGHVKGFQGYETRQALHDNQEWQQARQGCRSSIYGDTNAMEDYAETFAAYRYNGKNFKQQCPQKYQYMKEKVFAGIEYIDEASCHQISNSTTTTTASANPTGQNRGTSTVDQGNSRTSERGPDEQRPRRRKNIFRSVGNFFEDIFD